MNKNDYKYFNKARQAAMVSDYYKTHIGCIAVYQGSIIGIGCNCNKTHPTQKFYNRYRKQSDVLLPKLHAEISCINSNHGHRLNHQLCWWSVDCPFQGLVAFPPKGGLTNHVHYVTGSRLKAASLVLI